MFLASIGTASAHTHNLLSQTLVSATVWPFDFILQVQEVVKKSGFPVVIKPLKGSSLGCRLCDIVRHCVALWIPLHPFWIPLVLCRSL